MKFNLKNSHLIFLGIVSLNFSFVRLGSYGLTFAIFISALLVTFSARIPREAIRPPLIIFCLLNAYCLLVAIFSGRSKQVDLDQFFLSFLLFFTTSLLVILALSSRNPKISGQSVKLALMAALIVITTSVIYQHTYYRITGDLSVFNLFGQYLIYGQGYIIKAIEFGAFKSTSFYFEPSFAALVIFFIACSLVHLDEISLFTTVFSVISMLLVGSFAGILALSLLFAIYIFPDRTISSRKRIAAAALTISMLTILIAFKHEYIISRFASFQIENSSASYRLIAPLVVLKDVLLNDPFGLPLGYVEDNLRRFHLQNGDVTGTSIDNGWYVIVYHFGWPGLLSAITFSFLCVFNICKNNHRSLYLFLLLAPFFTGAVLSPEFCFLIVSILFISKIEGYYGKKTAPVHHYDLLPGHK